MKEEKNNIFNKFFNENAFGIFLRGVFGNGITAHRHAIADGIDDIEKTFRETDNNIARFSTSSASPSKTSSASAGGPGKSSKTRAKISEQQPKAEEIDLGDGDYDK